MRTLITAAVTLALSACVHSPALAKKVEHGVASIYYSKGDPGQNGTTVACPGRRLNDNALVFAHKSMPCGHQARVTYKGRSVVATCIDRGPYSHGRIIDLSRGAARAIGLPGLGTVSVEWL